MADKEQDLRVRAEWWFQYGEGVQAEPLIRDLLACVEALEAEQDDYKQSAEANRANFEHATRMKEAAEAQVQELQATLEQMTLARDRAMDDRDRRIVEAASLQREVARLQGYVQHLPDCHVFRCVNCGHLRWMHDRCEDLDEETCIHQGKGFTARTDCTCGLLPAPEGSKPTK